MYVFNGKLCAPCRASSDEPTATPAVRTERGGGALPCPYNPKNGAAQP